MNILYNQLLKAIKLTLVIFVVMQIINVVMGSEIHFGKKLLVQFFFTALYTFSLYTANALLFMKLDSFVDRNTPEEYFFEHPLKDAIHIKCTIIDTMADIKMFFDISKLDIFLFLIILFYVIL